jgi:hypothetical protein
MELSMTLPTQPLDAIPLWAVYLLTVGILLVATEVGFRVGQARQHGAPVKDNAVGPMTAATLGLVAFLLAFMVSLSAERFNVRRGLVLSEANAIGTAYLRAGYLPEPIATESRALLKEYVDVRLSALKPGALQAAIDRSEQIQVDLWKRGVELVKQTGGSDVYALYIESLNQVVEYHNEREIASLYARIPVGLLLALLGIAILGMFVLGFNNSVDGQRSVIALVCLVLVFGSVLYLIVDLDRGREGLFQVSYQPLINVQQRINP